VQKAIAGKLDCAFNNAGIDLAVKPLHEQSIEDFDKIMSINARGLLYEIRNSADKPRRRRDREQFINEWSRCASGISLCCQQTCSDGADAIGCLYAKQGIRINAVNPIATDLMARSADQMITFDDLGSLVPGRIGQATEIAQAVVFLCSDASYITGQPLAIYTAS